MCACLKVLHVCVSNASDTEFHLFIALGNEIDMASLTIDTILNIGIGNAH